MAVTAGGPGYTFGHTRDPTGLGSNRSVRGEPTRSPTGIYDQVDNTPDWSAGLYHIGAPLESSQPPSADRVGRPAWEDTQPDNSPDWSAGLYHTGAPLGSSQPPDAGYLRILEGTTVTSTDVDNPLASAGGSHSRVSVVLLLLNLRDGHICSCLHAMKNWLIGAVPFFPGG